MKRIFFIVFTCLIVNVVFSQNTTVKYYKSENGHFSFSFPSYLVQQKIDNAPHMLLKLDSKDYLLAISFWEYNFDSSVTAWNEDIVNNYKEGDKKLPNSKIEQSCEKINLALKDITVKCLKSIIWTTTTVEGKTYKNKQIIYRFIHKGNYIQFLFFVYEFNSSWSKSQFSDSIMKGLKLN